MNACEANVSQLRHPLALAKLPPFPPVAGRLMRLVTVDDIVFRQVAELIRIDAAFTGEVLRLANSPLLGCRYRIASVLHGLAILGLNRLKALVMTVALRNFLASVVQVPLLRRCWRHSLAVAFLCEQIGGACWLDRDQAYTAGLVHDVGRLSLMGMHPEEFTRLLQIADEGECDLRELERQEFDVDHCEAGRWLIAEWHFPAEYAEIVAGHHDEPVAEAKGLADVVRLGCRLADMLGFQVAGPALLADLEEIRRQLPEPARAELQDEEKLLLSLAGKINALECSLVYP